MRIYCIGSFFCLYIYNYKPKRKREREIAVFLGEKNLLCFVLGRSGGFSQRIFGSLLFKGGTTQRVLESASLRPWYFQGFGFCSGFKAFFGVCFSCNLKGENG